ncbi:MAG: LacI family transcriptional regulator [Oscillospiraceae bacterium]|nr:LacI family transcriptional regulator [Oscillospiraceae bacterium]
MSVTIKDIAGKLGISYTTVSRALNDRPDISEATKERVRAVAQSLGYSPNDIARGLVKNNTRTIGVIIQDIANPYFADIVRGIENYANKKDFTTFLGNSDWDEGKELKYIQAFASKRVDGLIINPVTTKSFDIIRNLNLSMPVVFVSALDQSESCTCIDIDNEMAAKVITEYLIDLKHTDIAFVGGNEAIADLRDRIRGYSKIMDENGLTKRIFPFSTPSLTRESGMLLGSELVRREPFPSAVIAANDFVALGLLEAFDDNKIRVPDDVSMVSFDNIDIAAMRKINLTTVELPRYRMGEISAEVLINYIVQPQDIQPHHILLNANFIVRGSSRAKKSNEQLT